MWKEGKIKGLGHITTHTALVMYYKFTAVLMEGQLLLYGHSAHTCLNKYENVSKIWIEKKKKFPRAVKEFLVIFNFSNVLF